MYFKKKKKKRSLSLANQKKKKWIEKNKNKKKRQRCPKKRKKEKKWQHYYLGEKEKKKNKGNLKKPMCTCTWVFLSIKKKFIPTQFSLHFGEKTFWWVWGENTWIPPFIFIPSYPAKHTPKRFFFPFSLQSFPSTLFHLQTNTP